jgi:hypothetical protein
MDISSWSIVFDFLPVLYEILSTMTVKNAVCCYVAPCFLGYVYSTNHLEERQNTRPVVT